MLNYKDIISAEVLLRSDTGGTIDENTIITSDNIADYVPKPESVQIVSQFFKDNGFEVSSFGGISITISGTVDLFSRIFNTSLAKDMRGGIRAVSTPAVTSEELPIEILPKRILDLIITVTFVPPPNFMSRLFQ